MKTSHKIFILIVVIILLIIIFNWKQIFKKNNSTSTTTKMRMGGVVDSIPSDMLSRTSCVSPIISNGYLDCPKGKTLKRIIGATITYQCC